MVKITMEFTQKLANELAEELALELKKVCPVQTGDLRRSIKVVKDGKDYVIQMEDYWKQVEYLSNPFIRFTLNTKFPDILKKVTQKIGR